MSLSGLTSDQLVAAVLTFVGNAVSDAGYEVCALLPWHGAPDSLMCCDCGPSSRYTVVAWLEQDYEAQANLSPAFLTDCAVLDASQVGVTVARCWPTPPTLDLVSDPRPGAAAELTIVLDALKAALGRCAYAPVSFSPRCRRFLLAPFQSRRSVTGGPYSLDAESPGSELSACAGWQFSLVVA